MAPLATRAATGKLTSMKSNIDELKKQRNTMKYTRWSGGGNGAYPASSTPKPQTFDATKPPGIIRQGIDAVRGFVTG
jgi:hypothetical protein